MTQRVNTISSREEALEIVYRLLEEEKKHSLVFIDGREWGVKPGSMPTKTLFPDSTENPVKDPEQNSAVNPKEKVAQHQVGPNRDQSEVNSQENIPGTRRYLFYDFEIWLEFSKGKARVCTSKPYSSDLLNSISIEVIHEIEQCTDPWKAIELFRSVTPGYHAGYLSYDLKNYRENLHSDNPDVLGLPELWIGYPNKVIRIQDINMDQVADQELHALSNPRPETRVLDRHPQLNEADYLLLAELAQGKIHEGDYYEINLSVLFSGTYVGEAFDLYRKISVDGSQPFSAFIHTGEIQICSASPERFLLKQRNQLYSSPMKGTAARDPDPERDWFQQKQLQESEKERAENLMIVDLVRNDFSRVCEPGTVKADQLFEIKSYPTVHQMISTVSGQIQQHVTPEEALAACFPMGSMTGAPKITALKDIEALESYRRGVYSGSIGFFTPDGDFDFNVVIRTAFCRDDGTYVYPAGSAITSDADGAQEWQEILLKTRVLTRS